MNLVLSSFWNHSKCETEKHAALSKSVTGKSRRSKEITQCLLSFKCFCLLVFGKTTRTISRSQWPCDLRRRSAAARLLRSWVQIPPGARMFVRCECCVLSGRGLCDELITCPEESYRLWCIIVCDLETSWMRRPRPTLGRSPTGKKNHGDGWDKSQDLF